ncbi:hypothetical protein QZH41_019815, partial [Actinostola sp. cb2023]
MGDELDLGKLSLEEKLSHKVWKARVNGYEELTKLFKQASSETSNEFSKYLGNFKKIVIDNNAVAQDKGLEATLAFLENAAPSISGRVAGDVISGCILKCFNARPKTKEKGIEIVLLYVEIEKQDIVQEELLKGLENKQPKIVTACTMVLRQIISDFGGKIFLLKPIVKWIPKLLENSDKNVREEAKQLSIEIYKWIKDALRVQLQGIKPVQLKELDDEWAALPPNPPTPTRLTRTQQKKLEEQQAQGIVPETSDACDGSDDTGTTTAEPIEIDPYEMMDAVDIISKLPKDFYENLEAKKWQLRKEALEALEKLASNPKHEGGQYGELLSALKKIICKDSNVMVVTLAVKCIGHIATGLRKKFTTYASMIVSALLEKFKEKKITVVTALRDAMDAVYLTTTLVAVQEDIQAALDSKNPNVKEETIKFLTRCFCKSTTASVPKGFLKPVCALLVQRMDDTVGPVRDATAEALGTLLKLLGEKPMNPYVDTLDKIKAEKVKECCDKAEIKGAPDKGGAGTTSSKPVAKPPPKSMAAPPSKPAAKKATTSKGPKSGGSTKSGGSSKSGGPPKSKKKAGGGKKGESSTALDEVREPEMTDEEVDDKAAAILPADVLSQLSDANWKERFSGMEKLNQIVEDMDAGTIECQVLIRVLAKKPGFKDSNFQVLKARLALCGVIAEKGKAFSSRSAGYAIPGLVEKIGDLKLKDQCKETLMKFAEKLNLNHVSLKVAKLAGGQKNPKVIAESLNWLGEAIKEFGFKIDLKPHIQFIKDCLTNTNPAVRTSAINLLGVLHMYVGASIRMFFEEEKPSLLQQIDAELEKVKGEKPPAPTRGLKSTGGEEEAGGDEEDGGEGESAAVVNVADLVPRTDISDNITPELIEMMGDKNWKVRAEGLQKVQGMISAAKFITSELVVSFLVPLKQGWGTPTRTLWGSWYGPGDRITVTLGICGSLATAMGPGTKKHLSTLGPALFSTLADAKPHLRAAGITALNAWYSEIGLVPFLDGEVLFGALSTENPILRTEVLGWLEEKLPNEQNLPSSLVTIVQPLYACIEDRSGDVRKKAQAVVPYLIAYLGYDTMNKQANKLKAGSKPTIQALLEKLRGTVPEPSKSTNNNKSKSKKTVESKPDSGGSQTTAAAASGGGAKRPKTAGQNKTAAKTSKKKAAQAGEGEDTGPPLMRYLGKDNRIRDEKELKVMKWNFATPRDEFIEQLKEQMRPCFSKSIITGLFHPNDFKQQVNAMNILQQGVTPSDDEDPPLKEEATQSLDLILKYLTIRFFDTNTTVLVKCLEFLITLLTMLAESSYQMVEHEASSFIPYLIQKVGDPKDVIRKMIRKLFKLLTKIYPASKMFTYVSEGLTSKNSKTRTECLEELGCLIQVFGMNVCQPSPPKAIANIATQIGDRDNGVRNAALNAIVEAYFLVGETVYKYAGRLNDKDLGYLEERIKRSSKNRPATSAGSEEPKPVSKPRGGSNDNEKKQAKPPARPATAPAMKRDESITREFQIDYDAIESDQDHDVAVPNLVSHETSVDELISEPIHRPTTKTPSSTHLGVFSRTSAPAALNYVISQIASSDIQSSTQAIVQLEVVIRNKTGGEIVKHVDQFLNAASLQLNIILTTHLSNEDESEQTITRLINCLINSMITLFCNQPLAKIVSRDTLKHLAQALITSVLDERIAKLQDGAQIIRAINVLVVKIIEKTDPTVCLGAMIRLLQESVKMLQGHAGNSLSSPKFMELTMKALWKMVRSYGETVETIPPLRTIRTILHSLAKLKGIDILACTNLIEDSEQSEVTAYLHRVLKTGYKRSTSSQMNGNSDKDTTKPMQTTPDILQGVENPKQPPTAKLNSKLAEIFSKIASKENTREGLVQLYEFKLTYPQADIDPFLKKTSPFFQNYIGRGLQNIEMERKTKKYTSSSTSTTSSIPTAQTSEEPSSYLDRLRVLRMRSGLGGNNSNIDN